MSESAYLLYLGCAIPSRVLSYEVATRKVAEGLDLRLVEMPEFSCCGLPLDAISHDMMLVLAAQNLCLAEQQELNIMTLCPGCNGTLCTVNETLKKDRGLRERVNGQLGEVGMEFRGEISVRHLVQVLLRDIGLKAIKDSVARPLKGLKAAAHHGCHLLRPSRHLGIDDPEHPTILKKLIEATGSRCLDYRNELECCGAPVMVTRPLDAAGGRLGKVGVSLQTTREKLVHLREAGAEALVTVCPSCYRMYDINQPIIERAFNESFNIPVLHYPELLALAMGIDPDELALNEHRIDTSKILQTG